jgi:hypothetical protein
MARTGDGIVAVFRNQSALKSVQVQLPLVPAGNFKVRSIFTGTELGTFSQADLVRGVSIVFGALKAEVLEVSRA